MNNIRTLTDGTKVYEEDIITKVYTSKDTTAPNDYTKNFINKEKHVFVGGDMHKFFNNHTESIDLASNDLLTLKIFNDSFLAYEHYLEVEFNVTSGLKTEKYMNLTNPVEKIVYDSATQTSTFYRNGTKKVVTPTTTTLTHSDGSVYNYDGSYKIVSKQLDGKTWTHDASTGTY